MSEQGILLSLGIIGLVAVDIAALKYLGIWGALVCGASYPIAEQLITVLKGMSKL